MNHLRYIVFFTICFLQVYFLWNVSASLAIDLNAVYPSLGSADSSLDVDVRGDGFLPSSRLTMSMDTLNRVNLITEHDLIDSPELPEYYNVNDIAVKGHTAYVAITKIDYPFSTPLGGYLRIVDITDPTNPKLITQLLLDDPFAGENCSSRAVVTDEKNDHVYVAAGTCGLKIVDVSIPLDAGVVKAVDSGTKGFALGVDIMGDYALVAQDYSQDTSDNGLYIIDKKNVDSAEIVSSLHVEGCSKVSAGDGAAYVIEELSLNNYGITHINLQNILTPQKKGSIPIVTYESGFEALGDTLYMTNGEQGFQAVSFSNPNSPVIVGSLRIDSAGYLELDPARNVAYVGAGNTLLILDIVDSANPALLGSVAMPIQYSMLRGIAETGGLIFAVDDYAKKMYVLDVSAPSPMTVYGEVETGGTPKNIQTWNDNAFITATAANDPDSGALLKYDVTDPTNPVLKDQLYLPIVPRDMVIYNNLVYIVGSGKLLMVNPATMATPKEALLNLAASDSAVGLDVEGDKAFIVTWYEDLAIVDVNPSSGNYLKRITLYDITSDFATPTAIDVVGNVAYIIKYQQTVVMPIGLVFLGYLRTVDVTNPLIPTPLGVDPGGFLSNPADLIVQGSTAYVADQERGLVAMNVSVPSAPTHYSTWTKSNTTVIDLCGIDSGKLNVLSRPDGVLAFDITTDPTNPLFAGSVGVQGWPEDGAVSAGKAFISSSQGVTVVPLPFEIPVTYLSADRLTASMPKVPMAGNYTLRVFNGATGKEQTGAVTFTTEPKLLTSKAIIVSGGGASVLPTWNNLIWDETKAYANYAYDNLIYQGYKHEDIMYLTDEPDALARYGNPPQANLMSVTKANLQYAINTWALSSGSSDLLLYMEDHGNTEEFILNGATGAKVSAYELDSWLDTLQDSSSGKVIMVYDACRSGSFIYRNRPPSGKIRIVLTSSTPDQTSYFLSANHSFSSHFWSTFTGKAGSKAILSDAFDRATINMAPYQSSQVDANGNGQPNETEDYTELEKYEGTIYALRRQYNYTNRSKPVIPIISPDQAASGASLFAQDVYDVDGDTIARVWAEIYGPENNLDQAGTTVQGSALPSVDLADSDSDGIYTPVSSPTFRYQGTYLITYYAEDSSGIYSLPKTSLVSQAAGATGIPPDQYEDDNAYTTAQVITVDDPVPQNHSFHVTGDKDWVVFYGVGGAVYNIRAMSPTVISDPVITLYNGSLNTQASSNTGVIGQEEAIIGWTCPLDGIYYVRVTNNSSHYGANVRYKLRIYNPAALSLPEVPGAVSGMITSGGSTVSGALVSSPGAQPQYTNSSGVFQIFLTAGTHTVTVSCPGYQSISFQVTVSSGQIVNVSPPEMNSVPQFVNTPPIFAKTYAPYSYVPVVVDSDGDSYGFTISGKPGWAKFNTVNGTLSGMPTTTDIGIYSVTITVTDSKGSSSSKSFTITVTEGTPGLNPGVFMLLLI